jgi:uncharacterized protein with von Willebrand factor type A (vWA) domain
MSLPAAAAHLAGFARLLRAEGFAIAPEQIAGFLAAVELLGPRSMEDIRQAALAMLGVDPEKLRTFEALYRAWFWGEAVTAAAGEGDEETRIKDDRGDREQQPLGEEQVSAGERASFAERLAARRFPSGEADAAGFARSLAGALPRRRSFRDVRALRGRHDLRRSMRRMVGTEGDISRPSRRRRLEVQRRLLLLIDISGSMKLHTEGHLRLAHTLVRNADRVEVFTLGTRLTRITTPLRIADRELALARVAETVEDWDGGTRIGPALLALLSVPRFAAYARGAAVVVLSDGLERDGYVEMERAFRKLKARAFRLSLLTPLAADPRFRPRTAALRAVLPHLDDLADGSGVGPVSDFILSLARPARRAGDLWREAG